MSIERSVHMNLLFDFYSQLLTEHQRTVFRHYYHDDLSLGEIAEDLGVTRQAVYDLLRRSERALESYEARLGLVKRYLSTRQAMAAVKEEFEALAQDVAAIVVPHADRERLSKRITELGARIERLLTE